MESLVRMITTLQVEADMIESHAHKLIDAASRMTDSDEQHNLLSLANEEGQQAANIRKEIQLLKDRLCEGSTPAAQYISTRLNF